MKQSGHCKEVCLELEQNIHKGQNIRWRLRWAVMGNVIEKSVELCVWRLLL